MVGILENLAEFGIIVGGSMLLTMLTRLRPEFMVIYLIVQIASYVAMCVAIYNSSDDTTVFKIVRFGILIGAFIGFYDLVEVMFRYDPGIIIKFTIPGFLTMGFTLFLEYLSSSKDSKSRNYFEDEE